MAYSDNWNDLISTFGYGFVDDLKQYNHIVKVWAYTDMQPRTIDGLGVFRKNNNNRVTLDRAFDDLAKQLYDFVNIYPRKNCQANFDKWHEDTCNSFVRSFNNIINNQGVKSIAFGKGQKILNVALKYIYCLKGAYRYADKFDYCHMTLDRYTYSEGFYRNEVIPWYNRNNPNKKLRKGDLKSWSNLSISDYQSIQENIRDFLKDKSNQYINNQGKTLTPFQAEFYIFEKYS